MATCQRSAHRRHQEGGVEILGLNGGDGTNHVTLSAFIRVYGDTPRSKNAFLRGGTMNTVDDACGIFGTPETPLYNLIEKYANQVSYHGAPAPRHRWRRVIAPRGGRIAPASRSKKLVKGRVPTTRHLSWASLLWRVFGEDGWRCRHCGGPMRLRGIVDGPGAEPRGPSPGGRAPGATATRRCVRGGGEGAPSSRNKALARWAGGDPERAPDAGQSACRRKVG